ncbi:hypothetical protein AGMMS49940_06610 [Spirochaetia bacterium]|nr:hypothetical protein AGMMS49940_06610 [Spirochaetia bacterium]
MINIAVIGAGYVGSVSGACLADFGNQVTCVDNNAAKIESLKKGIIPIYEPGLDTIVERTIRAGRLRFTTDLAAAVTSNSVVFIAVGTPPGGRRKRRPALCGGCCPGNRAGHGILYGDC